jgi:hypothetical protein
MLIGVACTVDTRFSAVTTTSASWSGEGATAAAAVAPVGAPFEDCCAVAAALAQPKTARNAARRSLEILAPRLKLTSMIEMLLLSARMRAVVVFL